MFFACAAAEGVLTENGWYLRFRIGVTTAPFSKTLVPAAAAVGYFSFFFLGAAVAGKMAGRCEDHMGRWKHLENVDSGESARCCVAALTHTAPRSLDVYHVYLLCSGLN